MMLFYINRIFSCIILVIFLTTNVSEGNTSDSLYKKGFQFSIEGKKQNAIEAYLEALKINPKPNPVPSVTPIKTFSSW